MLDDFSLLHAANIYRHIVAHSSATNAAIRLRERTNKISDAVQIITIAKYSFLRLAPFAKYWKLISDVNSAQAIAKTPKIDFPPSIPPKESGLAGTKISTASETVIANIAKSDTHLPPLSAVNADITRTIAAQTARTASVETLAHSNDIVPSILNYFDCVNVGIADKSASRPDVTDLGKKPTNNSAASRIIAGIFSPRDMSGIS